MTVLDEAAAQQAAAVPRMTGRQRAVLLLLLGSAFLLAADFSILNVAIPAIGAGLGFNVADLQWIATAFAIGAAGFTLLFGRVGDLYGRRRFFLGGIALLVAASVLGGAATTPTVLIVARVLQGLATAVATPTALALLTTAFPEGPLRAKALGLNGAMIAAGFTLGAIGGGLLTALLSWRWAFLINVPAGLAILIATPMLLTESKVAERTRLDVPGAVTVSSGLVSLVFGVSLAGHRGWGDPLSQGLIGLGLLLLVLFLFLELRADAPLAPVRILAKPTVLWGNLAGFVTIAMQTAVIFLMTLYLQRVLDFSPLTTGLAFGALGVASFVGGVLAPKLIGAIGNRLALLLGMVLQLLAAAALCLTGESRSGLTLVLAAMAVGAFGHLTAVVSYMVTATSGLPDGEQGLATGLATMAQQVALAVGIPVMSAVAATRINALQAHHGAKQAVLGGVHLALGIDAAVMLVGALVVTFFLHRASAARAAGVPAAANAGAAATRPAKA